MIEIAISKRLTERLLDDPWHNRLLLRPHGRSEGRVRHTRGTFDFRRGPLLCWFRWGERTTGKWYSARADVAQAVWEEGRDGCGYHKEFGSGCAWCQGVNDAE